MVMYGAWFLVYVKIMYMISEFEGDGGLLDCSEFTYYLMTITSL
jgi:hypothetical protein